MTIEEIQSKPYGEICTTLMDMAPRVMAAREAYQALAAEQTLYVNARTLLENDLRIGDNVRLRGTCLGLKNPVGIVVEPYHGELKFQMLKKNGQPHGDAMASFMFDGFEKI